MHPETRSVKVENIAECVSRQDIIALFNSLIGEVRKCERRFHEGASSYLELTFSTPDAAKKALCMTGYNVAGVPLHVAAIPSKVSSQPKWPDLRRNLYVLGLPIDLTKSEFISIFAYFGKVSHCVIMATVDNASRRRGFVVMSTHEEAKLAMDGLSGTDIKEYTIDVSWAVVQRSRGFLDGGDRTMMLNSSDPSNYTSSDSGSTTPDLFITTVGNISPSSCNSSINFLPPTSATLLVTNLPTLLFSDRSDLDPLLRPFGSIQTMQILNSETHSTIISVIVEYRTFTDAREAKAHLCGQIYAGFSLEVDHVHAGFPVEQSQIGSWRSASGRTSLPYSGHRKRTSPLNPFAAPFVAESQNNLSIPTFNPCLNFKPDFSYIPASELKQYHDMLPTDANAHAQIQSHYQDQQQYRAQYPALAIPTQAISYRGASHFKKPNGSLYPTFTSNLVSSVWSAQSHLDSPFQDLSYPSVTHSYSNVYA